MEAGTLEGDLSVTDVAAALPVAHFSPLSPYRVWGLSPIMRLVEGDITSWDPSLRTKTIKNISKWVPRTC